MIVKIKKIIPYLLILIALVGVFGYGKDAQAVDCKSVAGNDPVGCTLTQYQECVNVSGNIDGVCDALAGSAANPTGQTQPAGATTGNYLENIDCSIFKPGTYFNGCVVKFFNLLFVIIPSGALWVAAIFFNQMVLLVVQSGMYDDPFIAGAWVVVRDLSNIFFILILLYVAVKTVLNMGGHETKSTIASVIIMAILINFSLFFTKIVIDSSNILALIFYNKLDVTYKNEAGEKVDRANPHPTKDVAGAMYEKFNATKLISAELIEQIKGHSISPTEGVPPAGTTTQASSVISILEPKTAEAVVVAPWLIYVGATTATAGAITAWNYVFPSEIPVGPVTLMILIAGTIMIFAAYVLFTSGIFFIGRLIELWILMIFAPFAFMSFAVPKLRGIDYIGWDKWLEKLMATSFMAPIFMFFLYLIFKIMESGIFKGFTALSGTNVVAGIMSVILPALIILGLLLKAKEFAKKGGGQFGEMAMGMAKVAMGVVAGAGIGVVASGAQASLGRIGKKLAEDKTLEEKEAAGSWRAGALRTIGGKAATSSFDLRKGVGGGILKLASTATGLNLGAQSKILMKEDGGYVGDLKRRNDARLKRAEELKKAASGDATHELHGLEEAQQELLMKNGTDHEIAKLDSQIKAAEANKLAYKGVSGKEDMYEKYGQEVIRLKDQKRGIKNGLVKDKDGNYVTDNGLMSGKALEKTAEAMEGGVTSSRSAAEEARRIVAAAETSINTAKTNADTAMSAASKAIEEATAVERSLGNSLAPADIAQRETARATVEKTRQEAVNAENAIASAQADFAIAKANEADKESALATATEKYETVKGNIEKLKKEDREDRARGGKGKIGRSINDYEDDLIPNAKHDVKHAGNVVAWKYAETLEKQWFPPFREEELHHSAHEIRMGAKPEKGHGGGDHGGVSVVDDIVANVITDTLKGEAPAAGGHPH